jgi:hypothetical protein
MTGQRKGARDIRQDIVTGMNIDRYDTYEWCSFPAFLRAPDWLGELLFDRLAVF